MILAYYQECGMDGYLIFQKSETGEKLLQRVSKKDPKNSATPNAEEDFPQQSMLLHPELEESKDYYFEEGGNTPDKQ